MQSNEPEHVQLFELIERFVYCYFLTIFCWFAYFFLAL